MDYKTRQPANSSLDRVILVTTDDQVVGEMDKVEAHQGKGKLHRACSVFIFNRKGQVLVQQRSSKKIVAPRQWANTVCGNVRPQESYMGCAVRRLQEELGIAQLELAIMGKFQYSVEFDNGFTEREIDQVFAGVYEGEVKPNPDEVAQVDWVEFDQISSQFFTQSGRQLAPWVPIMLSQADIYQKLTNYV